MTLKIEHTFDEKTYRHYNNGHQVVLHCHHYMALSTRLAMDFAGIGGERVLRESAEDAMFAVISDYLKSNGITGDQERLNAGAEHFTAMGMGRMDVSGNANGGQVVLHRSHVDQGWVKKFGESRVPVGHFNCGFAIAVFRAAFDKPARAYATTESQSIAMGDTQGLIVVEPA